MSATLPDGLDVDDLLRSRHTQLARGVYFNVRRAGRWTRLDLDPLHRSADDVEAAVWQIASDLATLRLYSSTVRQLFVSAWTWNAPTPTEATFCEALLRAHFGDLDPAHRLGPIVRAAAAQVDAADQPSSRPDGRRSRETIAAMRAAARQATDQLTEAVGERQS